MSMTDNINVEQTNFNAEERFAEIDTMRTDREYEEAIQLAKHFLSDAPIGTCELLLGKAKQNIAYCLYEMNNISEAMDTYEKCRPHYKKYAENRDFESKCFYLTLEVIIAEKYFLLNNESEAKIRYNWCKDYAEDLLSICLFYINIICHTH